jgi:hypothetical protein
VRIAWGALLRTTDGKGSVPFDVAQNLREFFAQRSRRRRKPHGRIRGKLAKTSI